MAGLADFDERLQCCVTALSLFYICSLPRICSKWQNFCRDCFSRCLSCALYPKFKSSVPGLPPAHPGLQTTPLYCNAKPKAQLCSTVDQTASVHIIFSCTYILVPKGSEYVCSIACITWGIGEKWKILSPQIQVDLEWLRLGQEI